jgi:hypothetical protein
MLTNARAGRPPFELLASLLVLGAPCVAPAQAPVADSAAATHHLRTRWAGAVSADHPWPEYPRPQLVRPAWTNLNGKWDYAVTVFDAPQPHRWGGTILVPFAIQSQLSGVMRAVGDSQRLWYHRTFHAPALPPGGRLLLHFGAVDWQAHVLVNGVDVGEHRGGYDPFSFDITDALRGHGDQDLVVSVDDPTDHGPQPRGKQVLKPGGIWYTAVTGIWQTVWLEPVRAEHVSAINAVPDIDAGTVTLHVTTDGAAPGTQLRATALSRGRQVAAGAGSDDSTLVLHIPHAHLWSPSDPFLYDLRVTLSTGDTVQSYFGMRKISLGHDSSGIARLYLNNHPLFEFGLLDQGWWPDGLYTAPTDAAMRFDLVTMKHLGFNLIRKHVKVEPARWYTDADRLGMLVWQDMPSGDNNTDAGKTEFASELHHVVDALRDHPSIVMWVPFNEGWGQHDTPQYVAWIKAHDPSRLVDNASGWTDRHVGDVVDMHDYPGPGMPTPEADRAAVLGEFGGLGLPLAGHTWIPSKSWGYRSFTSRAALGAAFGDLMQQLRWLVADGLSAAIYTQTTDVESEVNGLMTYDRAVIKLPPGAIASIKTVWAPVPVTRVVMPTSQAAAQSWRYTTATPPANWMVPGFGDSSWSIGPGGFGTTGTPGAVVRTTWSTADIWLRRTFTLGAVVPAHLQWRLHHDEDVDLYINGTLALHQPGYTAGYRRIPLDSHARALLKPGVNTLAVHVHQTTGGQYIDVGLDETITP